MLIIPAWWVAGQLQDESSEDATVHPFFRLLCAVGLALLSYIIFVNLIGRLISNSIIAVLAYLFLNLIVILLLLWNRPANEFCPIRLLSTWREWVVLVLLGCVLGLPQWVLAVSTPFWDEVACSAIHLTAPNQFAEGLFPPRHNALPDIIIKYHYAFTILSGTVRWLLGISANVAIDIVSTSLWLFIFLFTYFWFRQIRVDRLAAAWAAFTLSLGGGLAWLYLRHIELYDGLRKVPLESTREHLYDPAKSWLANLISAAVSPDQYLRNADKSLSILTWDIAAQFQQHAVSVGMAMTLVALFLFTIWQKSENKRGLLLAVNIAAFSVIFLGHAVFGTVAAVATGTYLFLKWVGRRNWRTFVDGLLFTFGVATLAFLHGGMLAAGSQYGQGGFMTPRRIFGYSLGGISGFLNWNIASFGLPLLFTILAWALHHRYRDLRAAEHNILFVVLTVFALFSYLVPQIAFYSSETYRVEQFTEVSKFFFSAHFAFALLSAFGIAYLGHLCRWWVIAPCFLAMAISPVIYCYANSVNSKGEWLGFYRSPYYANSIEEKTGKAMSQLKKTNHDVFFDASADERHHGFLSEMFIFGGSVFSTTPSRFERTGVGFRLSEEVVARRYMQNSRLARLLPGAAEDTDCSWYYCSPMSDSTVAPLIVRSRFAKLIADGSFSKKYEAGLRVLYSIEKPTVSLDDQIERFWSPRIVSQTISDHDGDGKNDLIFFDYVEKKILSGLNIIELPEWLHAEFVNLYVGRFPGDSKSDFVVGRMTDTLFSWGERIEETIEHNSWAWSYRNSSSGKWESEYNRWFWDIDIPIVADINHSGFASHLAYRPDPGLWLLSPDKTIPGPKVEKGRVPVPFVGRFLNGSDGDLGIWSLMDGMLTLQTVASGESVSFRWGGTYGYTLVPGDYDGDGSDEIGIYNRADFTWYWRHAPDGTISSAGFGTKTSIPLPWDYNHDGHLDLAYWEPSEGKIFVSYTLGREVDLVVKVPPHSIPAFVNMN